MKETSAGNHKRLLLIDDDPNLILLVKDYLEFRGYKVITAENGREALEVLEQETPDYDYLRCHDARDGRLLAGERHPPRPQNQLDSGAISLGKRAESRPRERTQHWRRRVYG